VHIKRMTLTLPPRLRHVAEHEARRIAETTVARMGDKAPAHIRVELNGNGACGHSLAQAVARGVAARTKGGL
jgi:hypothetical protein